MTKDEQAALEALSDLADETADLVTPDEPFGSLPQETLQQAATTSRQIEKQAREFAATAEEHVREWLEQAATAAAEAATELERGECDTTAALLRGAAEAIAEALL